VKGKTQRIARVTYSDTVGGGMHL